MPRLLDPARYGVTLEEWRGLDDIERKRLREKYKRLRKLAKNPNYERERYARTAEKRRALKRALYYRHHEAQLARSRRRTAKSTSLRTIASRPQQILQQVMNLVPSGLPRDAKDDIAGSVLLAVVEGKMLVRDLGRGVSEFVRAYNRDNDPYKTRSLNETIRGGKREWIDTLTDKDRLW